MAIRRIKKELDFPPAHLYLEDIEELVEQMIEADKLHRHEDGYQPRVRFVISKKRECDSIDDLLKLGGTWRNFEIKTGSVGLHFTLYDTYLFDNNADLFNHTLQLTMRRTTPLRALMRKYSLWWYIAWIDILWVLLIVTATRRPLFITVASLLSISLIVVFWSFSAHTFVELRYSHDPSPKWAALKAQGGRAAWIAIAGIVGSAATLFAQWCWKRFMGQ